MSDRALEVACASLTIIESLLLELKEKQYLSSQEVNGILDDALEAHRNVSDPEYDSFHRRVAKIIELLAHDCDATNVCRNMDKFSKDAES